MYHFYNPHGHNYNDERVKEVTRNVEIGTVCACPNPWVPDRWSRCKIEKLNQDDDTVAIWFLDYGGFYEFHRADVKRIDSCFLKVPFQARLVQIVNLDEKAEIEQDTKN